MFFGNGRNSTTAYTAYLYYLYTIRTRAEKLLLSILCTLEPPKNQFRKPSNNKRKMCTLDVGKAWRNERESILFTRDHLPRFPHRSRMVYNFNFHRRYMLYGNDTQIRTPEPHVNLTHKCIVSMRLSGYDDSRF